MVFKNRKLIFKLDEKRDAIMDIHVEFSFWGHHKYKLYNSGLVNILKF